MGVDIQMYVLPQQPLTDQERRQISGALRSRLPDFFWITRPGECSYELERDQHALNVVTDSYDAEYCGFEHIPNGLLSVSTMHRYYGPGYERGPWPDIKQAAEMLEALLPECTIWYGGDSGERCDIFDAAFRSKINQHFLTEGHEPYRGYVGPWRASDAVERCDFCGGRPMHNVGGGGDKTFWNCDGCGHDLITQRGIVAHVPKDSDFFAASKALGE